MSVVLAVRVAVGLGAAITAAYVAWKTYYSHRNNTYQTCPLRQEVALSPDVKCSICWKNISSFSNTLKLPCGNPVHRACVKMLINQEVDRCLCCRRKISQEFFMTQLAEI